MQGFSLRAIHVPFRQECNMELRLSQVGVEPMDARQVKTQRFFACYEGLIAIRYIS